MALLASTYDQSRFLRAEDIPEPKKFRIKGVTEEMVGQGEDQQKKLVVNFTNDRRGLVLNKTNNRTIRKAFGDDTAGWAGQIIVIFPTMVDMRGKMTAALRVRLPEPKPPTTVAAATPQPSLSGNGAAVVVKPETAKPPARAVSAVKDHPELADDPAVSLGEEMSDEVPF